MRVPLQVKVSDSASAQIEDAARWWAEHRPAAPGAVREDIDRILGVLSVEPGLGTVARSTTLRNVRRITLPRIRYYLYYQAMEDSLEVLALGHTGRGRPPAL